HYPDDVARLAAQMLIGEDPSEHHAEYCPAEYEAEYDRTNQDVAHPALRRAAALALSIVETVSFRRKALRLDPVDDQLRNGVAVLLQHQHVAVAGDTEVAEIDEVGLGSVGVEPVGDRFV